MSRGVIYTFLIVFACFFLIPVYLVVVTAFKDPATINLQTVWDLPSPALYFDTYEQAITHMQSGELPQTPFTAPFTDSFPQVFKQFGPRFTNSIILVIFATTISAILGSMNGYILAKWRIPYANVIFPLMLFGMFIPYQAILVPLSLFLRDIEIGGTQLYGGLPGLILIHVVYGLPITTLIFRNFYADIPNELIEAGAIDGAGFFGIYTNIVFPLSIPGFVVVIIWQFTQIWNEFLFGITMTSNENQPITVGLSYLAGGEAVKYNLPMAGAIVAALPPLFVYIVAGRYFIRGLLAGSVKG
ncbi:MAG: carbohydrate ABC transporter permease [bacterium]|nr:carbohydrate ABC transporter permease [bacterium]